MANGTSWLTHMWSGTVYQALLAMKHPETLQVPDQQGGHPGRQRHDGRAQERAAPEHRHALHQLDAAPRELVGERQDIGYPMMTTAGLKTYGGLTKKYPWLKVTTDEVENGQRFKPQDPKTLQLWNTAWSKIQGVRQASPGAARPLVGIPHTAGSLARRALPGPAGADRRGLVRLGRLPRPGDLRLAVQRLGPQQLPHGPDRGVSAGVLPLARVRRPDDASSAC